MEPERYLTFKGISVPFSTVYYLCDFYRYTDPTGQTGVRVEYNEAHKGVRGPSQTLHLRCDAESQQWHILEAVPLNRWFARRLQAFVSELMG